MRLGLFTSGEVYRAGESCEMLTFLAWKPKTRTQPKEVKGPTEHDFGYLARRNACLMLMILQRETHVPTR